MRKKIIIGVSLLLAFVLFIVIIENKDKVKGTEGILKVAYKEIAADGVDKSDYSIVDSVTKYDEITRRNENLVWIMTENKAGIKNYYPLMFEVLENDRYSYINQAGFFRHEVQGVCSCLFGSSNNYTFMIDNPDYKYINLYDENRNLTQIKIDSIPFVYYADMQLREYTYVTSDGKEVYSNGYEKK
ncbi:MAG: hypothetical protein IJB72_02690 [Clostridia bacterium]|nr:hypothetical protein [Clostridia bacterium]